MGGFDESYRKPSIEDIELGYRLKQAGLKIRLCKALQVKHLKRWEVVSLLRADFFYRALPWTELILRDRQFMVRSTSYPMALALLLIQWSGVCYRYSPLPLAW